MANQYFTPPSAPIYQPNCFDWGTLPARVVQWKMLLYDLIFSVFNVTLPEGWQTSPLRYMLFGWGSIGVAYSKKLGWIYGPYGVEKIGWQYEPLLFNVTNILLDAPVQGVRGINGVVLHVRDDWMGYDPLITEYAKLLASCDKGMSVNLTQSRYGKIYGVENIKDADTLRSAFASADEGEPIVFVSKRLMGADGRLNLSSIMGEVAKDFYADKIMETRLMILKDFLTRVGVRTVAMEKREHLLNQEIDENNDETSAAPYVMMTSLEGDLELLNKMGCNISITPRYDYSGAGQQMEGGIDNGKFNVI